MWNNRFKDYKKDEDFLKEKIETAKGIVGCEMHEIHGWGELHHDNKKKPSFLSDFLHRLRLITHDEKNSDLSSLDL